MIGAHNQIYPQAMSWTQCLFSKLIEACEMDWIPDEDALYGEHLGAVKNQTELKQLVYRSSRTNHPTPTPPLSTHL